MNSTTPAPPPQKRPSRSNSTSSPMTLKKPVSLSSRSAPRSSYLRGRSTSPDSISRVLNSLNSSRTDIPRQDALERKPGSNVGGNRWSHSTSSSISGIDTDLIKKRTSSSGATRRSAAGHSANGPTASSQDLPGSRGLSKGKATKRGPSATSSAESSRLNFQDSSNLNIVKDLSQASSNTSSDFFGPAWEHRTGLNKFGEPVSGLSIQYTADPISNLPPLTNGGIQAERKFSSQGPGHRDRSANKSKDQSKASVTSDKSNQSRKGQRSPKQKDMLSKALAKANAAVLLDNAQDIEGAIEAYNEACVLLEQVMARSADLEDRRKLSEIRMTYSTRIAELHDLDQPFAELRDKELPEDPPVDEYYAPEEYYQNDTGFQSTVSNEAPAITLPLRQESLLPQIFGGDKYMQNQSLPPVRKPIRNSQLHAPMDAQFMPSPLAPRNPSPRLPSHESSEEPVQGMLPPSGPKPEATSWLDNVDGVSSRASSRLSSNGFGLHNVQLVSDIEADLDAAMNAAIDTAYEDQGSHEPTASTADMLPDFVSHGAVSEHSSNSRPTNRFDHLSNSFLDDEAENEEKLLEQATRDYGFETPVFDNNRANPTLPRQSDSSGFSSRTWDSSHASTAGTSGTALSTLAEANEPVSVPAEHQKSLPAPPPPSHSRSESLISQPPSAAEKHVPIRDRRLSGQSAKQLKIETFSRRASISHKVTIPLPAPSIEEPKEEPPVDAMNQSFSSTLSGQSLTPMTSMQSVQSSHGPASAAQSVSDLPNLGESSLDTSPPLSSAPIMPPPPPPVVRKNMSSSSLQKTSLTINTQPDLMGSPGTPGSAMFSGELKRQISNSTPAVMTPGANILTSGYGGGMYLFDDQVGSTRGIHSPADGQPAALEPCPESFLLRPFWLMRCLFHALSHPHGGYITQKLFIPRDIWRVRNVKIKALEDKVSQCDLLSAALQKLAQVDMLDASAVLEEMQAFEAILEQARGILSKRLGNDVGVSGIKAVFGNSPAVADETDSATPRSANPSSAAKSFASGWRKLRSKSSSANLNNSSAAREVTSPSFTMQSLPMTASSSVALSRSYLNQKHHPPPTPSQLPNLIAPHAIYLSSLARLFEAAQVLDSIARQVEDPGLKHSSQTHVGLELCVRNAAEFFAFYVVRFVMGDILLLVDKFLKRGTEWVMT